MGKKHLKSNRHKKLKAVDPFYVGERKLLIDKNLINANQAPKKEEENVEKRVTGRLKEFLDYKNLYENKRREVIAKINTQNSSVRKRKKEKRKAVLPDRIAKEILDRKKPDEKGAEVPVRAVPKLERMPFESDAVYLNRVENYTQNVINRSKYESQFDVKLETKDGQVVFKKEKKMSDKKRRRLEKLKDRLKQKKNDRKLEAENKQKRPEAKFGEVVHQPPEITAFPKKREKIVNPTITTATKRGITENDRKQVVDIYRRMKKQGKFN